MPINELSVSSHPCKCCGAASIAVGENAISKCCEDRGVSTVFADAGVACTYFQCSVCGFLFTPYFDEWSHAEWKDKIYNDDYVLADPDFVSVRPQYFAENIQEWFHDQFHVSMLDYGGGQGKMADQLRKAGFDIDGFDPFFDEKKLDKQYDVVFCIEVFEHTVDPVHLVSNIVAFLKQRGAVIFTTMLLADRDVPDALEWSYVAPRNGHISIYTAAALHTLWLRHNCLVLSLETGVHMAIPATTMSEPVRSLVKQRHWQILNQATRLGVRNYLRVASLLVRNDSRAIIPAMRHLAAMVVSQKPKDT